MRSRIASAIVPPPSLSCHSSFLCCVQKIDEKLFEIFNEKLEEEGIIKHEGVIIDATFVDAPRQRNTRDENKEIKEEKIPKSWLRDDPKSKHKLCQKDTDARWTKKRNETHYGYKNRPLTDLQKLANKLKSRIRCRVEHIFGYMTNSFHGLTFRCIGKTRAYFNMGFTNVVYNICRYKTLKSL